MLEIRGGKLYQNGKEIKLEVGNKEHIELLRQHGTYHHEPELTEEEVKEIEYEGIDLEISITTTAHVEFVCLCGRSVTDDLQDLDGDFDGRDFDGRDLEGDQYSCICGKEYRVTDGGEKVSLIKK